MDYSSFKLPTNLNELIDFNQPSLYISLISILFNPIFWNIVARKEYRTHFLTKLAFNNPYYGCYSLAITIFSLGILRDHLFTKALLHQPTLEFLGMKEIQSFAMGIFGLGALLVISSMWALGITGTYLGDYFDNRFLLDKRVESFPFNVTNNPMYYGSTLSFLGTALWYKSPVGILFTIIVFIEYKIALLYEEPFTAAIYALRDAAILRAKKNPHRSPVKTSQFSALSPSSPSSSSTSTSTAIKPTTPSKSRISKSSTGSNGSSSNGNGTPGINGTPVRRSTRGTVGSNAELVSLSDDWRDGKSG